MNNISNGPITLVNGDKYWFQNEQLHRLDGPAVEYINGSKFWYQHGQRHRLDGPAIEWSDGTKCWYVKDKRISCSSQQEFERLMKLKSFW